MGLFCNFAAAYKFHLTMGRIFEVRKHAMFARWDRMAKQFTRIGKEIAIAVKAGGPDPATNPALRRCFLVRLLYRPPYCLPHWVQGGAAPT